MGSDKVNLNRVAKTIAQVSEGEVEPVVMKKGDGFLVLLRDNFAVAFEGNFSDCLSYLMGVRNLILVQHYG